MTDWADRVDWPIECSGFTLRVVKDLSEVGEEAGANILWELAIDQLEAQPKFVFLIAANEGRLRAVLSRERLQELYAEVDRQLREGPDLSNERLIVLNLNWVTTSSYVPQALAWLTNPFHWQACQGCPAFDGCPIRFNATRLADAHIASQLKILYQILDHLDVHVTIRDMLIHLAYTLTGGLNCETVIEQSRLDWEPYHHIYYENVWGEVVDEIFRRRVVVIRHLRRLNVGQASVFEVDDFIVNGRPNDEAAQAEYNRLFSSALDLGDRRFAQERAAYLHGGSSSPNPEEEPPLMDWLAHCRRKLFFEWQDKTAADRLFPFLYLADYFRLINGDRATLERYRRDLILGLNRAFSGLYLNDADYLYVTSQYAHAVEQPVPIVRVQIPAAYVDLRVDRPDVAAFDQDRAILHVEIPPPPRVQAEPLRWEINLLRFEYFLRRARGGTPDILATECELSIRQLKDDLLTRFAFDEADEHQVKFFIADRNRYHLHTLWVDEAGKIRV